MVVIVPAWTSSSSSTSARRSTVLFLSMALLNAAALFWIYESLHQNHQDSVWHDSSHISTDAIIFDVSSPPRNETIKAQLASPSYIQTCETCLLDPDNALCRYGVDAVRLSRSYQGSGHRVRKFLEKAARGERVKIGVIGASVSAGHGLAAGEKSWHARFMDDFKTMFPQAELYDGSLPATDSLFFSYCFKTILPEPMDLYIVELDVNNPSSGLQLIADDALYRAILSQRHEPAMIRASFFALSFEDLARGYTSTLLTSNHFDVPVITNRNFLLPHLLENPEEAGRYFGKEAWVGGGVDLRHQSGKGHESMADMLSLYIRDEMCRIDRDASLRPPPAFRTSETTRETTLSQSDSVDREWSAGSNGILGKIPRLPVYSIWSETEVEPNPNCQCQLPSIESSMKPFKRVGQWKQAKWNDKTAWSTWTAGSSLSFTFRGSKAGVAVWRHDGSKTNRPPGKALCYVVRAKDRGRTVYEEVVDAYADTPVAMTQMVILSVELDPTQDHIMTCQLLGSSAGDDEDEDENDDKRIRSEWRFMGFVSR